MLSLALQKRLPVAVIQKKKKKPVTQTTISSQGGIVHEISWYCIAIEVYGKANVQRKMSNRALAAQPIAYSIRWRYDHSAVTEWQHVQCFSFIYILHQGLCTCYLKSWSVAWFKCISQVRLKHIFQLRASSYAIPCIYMNMFTIYFSLI